MPVSKISALALAAALSFGALAIAQDAPPAAPAAHHEGDREAMHKHMQEHMAAHVKAFHEALNIRPDQESAFNAVVAAMHPHEGEMGAGDHPMDGDHDKMGADHAAMEGMTTPERLGMMARKMDERAARMHEHMQQVIGSVKALYAALSPEQRKTFDALARLHEMSMGHEHGMGGKGHEHGMGEMGHEHMGDDHHE